MPSIEESYAHCRRIARSRARNFFYSFVLLPRPQRDSMCAIYAFMREADDIADNENLPLDVRHSAITAWRRKLRDHLNGSGEDDVLPALCDAIERNAIPHSYFFELLDGMESDLTGQVFRTFDELYHYCYQAAAVVGLTTIHVFGFETEAALRLAERCGIAFQLTNIMRDVPADASMGRVYFPEAELEDFGLSRHELLAGTVSASDDRFQRFMEFQWERAEGYYREAAGLIALTSPPSRAALWAMITTYRGILQRIRRARFDVFGPPVSLSTATKVSIAARAFLLRATGGVPSFPA